MAARKPAGTSVGVLPQRCVKNLLPVLALLEAGGTLALMSYALLYEAGNLVNLPDKRIGFYNFCLWDDAAGELQCLDTKQLQAMGISLLQLGLARVCVYTCLVFVLFHLPFVLNVNCTGQGEGWKMIRTILFIKMIILSGGLGMFLLQGIPTAALTMAARKPAGTSVGVLPQRCVKNLLPVLALLEAGGTLALMSYALLYEAGNLVNLPDKRIGFYNFCLWDDAAGELQCLDTKQLQAMGISLLQLGLARVCVYTCLVFVLFHLPFVLNVNCTGQGEGWKMIRTILFIKMIILSGGLGMFLLQTSHWIHPSDFTGGFLALLGTQVLLLLQILTATVYLSWAKHTHVSKPFN